ncbi:MAG: endonuclease [Gemmatimonadetes bacterium]|nr:endonuclease [Gemmatimonadota bacterium]
MPTNFNVLSWNIRDLGADQVADDDFIELVAKIIRQENIDLVSILETKSDKGAELGKRITKKLGAGWDKHSSVPSAPTSNKPENYVFMWKTAKITNATGFKFADNIDAATGKTVGFPRQHTGRRPSRYPYLGEFTVGGRQITFVSFHATFTSVDIAESNQKLAAITEVRNKANVVVMGDFNDHPINSRTYRGARSFQPLVGLGFAHKIATATSLSQAFDPTWTTTVECRSSVYDNFFVKSAAGQISAAVGSVVDGIAALRGGYLESTGRLVFNNWAKRANAYELTPARVRYRALRHRVWAPVPLFGPTERIATIEDAHEVHWVCLSDHLPVKLATTVT